MFQAHLECWPIFLSCFVADSAGSKYSLSVVGLAEFENPRVRTLANPLFAKELSPMLRWPSVAAEPPRSRDLVSTRQPSIDLPTPLSRYSR